jgi:hypothetical protein
MHGTGFSRVPYTLAPSGTASHSGQTPAGHQSTGTASSWTVSSQDFELSLLDVQWTNGERSVHATTVVRGRQAIRHLESGHRRLGAEPEGTSLRSDLRIARIDPTQPNEWTTLTNASAAELARIHGLDWADRLSETFGARIGTKADLLGTTDTTKNRLCAIYPRQSAGPLLPHLFILTRLIPLALGITK